VALYRPDGNDQFPGDVGIGQTMACERGDFLFSPGQRGEAWRLGKWRDERERMVGLAGGQAE